MAPSPSTPFVRDRFTWLAYAMLAYYAYLQAILGPIMPFLRQRLNLSYSGGGLHPSAFAAGMLLAGLTADRLVRARGRQAVFWGGGGGLAVGAVLLAVSFHVALSVPSVFLMGFAGTLLLIVIAAALADRHGAERGVALLEANIAAIISATLSPLLVGLLQGSGVGWATAVVLPVLVFVFAFARYRGVAIPSAADAHHPAEALQRPLPRAFWLYWVVLILSVAAEWSLVYWSADFIALAEDVGPAAAAAAVTVFFVGAVIGRVVGSRLARRYASERLLLLAAAIALVAFPLLWLAPQTAVKLAALLVVGLGVSNLYPLLLAIATGLAPALADVASARVALGTGLAILSAPFLLGSLADRIGLQTAYGLIGVLLLTAVALTWVTRRRRR